MHNTFHTRFDNSLPPIEWFVHPKLCVLNYRFESFDTYFIILENVHFSSHRVSRVNEIKLIFISFHFISFSAIISIQKIKMSVKMTLHAESQ